MRKTVIKLTVFLAVFLITLFAVSKFMNRGHDNLTMEMLPATLPVVTMGTEGIAYNQLHGYTEAQAVAFQRDSVTVLGESRDAEFVVDTFGRDVHKITMEVRSADGARLIEDTEIRDLQRGEDRISGRLTLKDLIEQDTEYALAVILELEEGQKVSYYTRVIWSDVLNVREKLEFCTDFHEKLYDREAAKELTKYLETNSRLEDNSSYHKVNINSSFRQITWGDLEIEEVMSPTVRLTEIAEQTASVLLDYVVATTEGRDTSYYKVQEYYRVRYTADRMYLLDYERTMTQIPDENRMLANDKILLGIMGTDVNMVESEDGNVVIFEVAGRLFSYNLTTDKLTVIFSFYDENHWDVRTVYDQHGIRILKVDEGGNVQFAVYGYMNRGRHEGEVGIQLYTHNSTQNTIEELLYIPYNKTYAVLEAELEQLLYLNREQKLYLALNQAVYSIDLTGRTYSRLLDVIRDDGLQVSEDQQIAVWPQGEDLYHSIAMEIRNFSNDTRKIISVDEGETIRPLGFMEDDIIYGVANEKDIVQESSGRVFYPMYKICICNASGEVLKVYSQEGIYVTECSIEGNQITLERVRLLESGEYREAEQEHITNNMENPEGKNVLMAVDTERYKRYVEIQVRKNIEEKNIKILTPKEVVYEGGRRLQLPEPEENGGYYVYGPYGVSGIFHGPASAVKLAWDISGTVIDGSGSCVWIKGNRAAKNQIMAIQEAQAAQERSSLAVCLDEMLAYEGISRNTQYLLDRGETVLQILEEHLVDATVLDLTGCNLDAVLYYVNKDIPVLALLEDGSAVLLVGFNEFNTGILDPGTGTIYKKGMNDSREWFEQNGNQFITYRRNR